MLTFFMMNVVLWLWQQNNATADDDSNWRKKGKFDG
jgi:hypothetical protein